MGAEDFSRINSSPRRLRSGQLGGGDLIRLKSSEFKNLASEQRCVKCVSKRQKYSLWKHGVSHSLYLLVCHSFSIACIAIIFVSQLLFIMKLFIFFLSTIIRNVQAAIVKYTITAVNER